MSREATVVILDNSEWTRNGDYMPSRLDAQVDAANILCGAKTQASAENCCAVAIMAGKAGARVLLSLTPDMGKILNATHGIEIAGSADLISALKIGTELVAVAKQLRSANVNVDIVNFGELEQNTEKLEKFIETVNKESNSHIVSVPPGPHILSNLLIATPIIQHEGAAGAAGNTVPGMAGADFYDQNNDPECAEALRQSLITYEQEQKASLASSVPPNAATSIAPGISYRTPVAGTSVAPNLSPLPMQSLDQEDEELRQAVAMSLAESGNNAQATQQPAPPETSKPVPMETDSHLPSTSPQTSAPVPDVNMEDADMALAFQMSIEQPQPQQPFSSSPQDVQQELDVNALLQDKELLNSILNTLPGVDPTDPSIQNAIASLQGQKKEEGKKDEKREEKK